jgi:multicomponent Na+:H+ antiporter subunit D
MCPSLILAPFLGIIILNLLPKRVNYIAGFWFAVIFSLIQIISVFFPGSAFWRVNEGVFGNVFKFPFLIDTLTLVMLFCIGLVVFIALLVSREFTLQPDKRLNFINIILVAVAGMNGVVLVSDIFSLYVFLEIVAVASFILIAFDKDLLAFEGAFKYIVLSSLASVFMISAIALLFMLANSTDFSAIRASVAASQRQNIIFVSCAGLFLAGFFIKSAAVPFHGWLADAYSSAPAPVSVLLAGIVTKVAGAYALIRVSVTCLGLSASLCGILLFFGMASVLIGAFAALGQRDFKRMLAYSSISQVGYIILGLGSGTLLGVAAATLHIFNHSLFKSLLFVNAAAVEKQSGSRDMEKISGLSRQMPLTGLSSVLASLSCAGIPPLAGFWSKFLVIVSLWFAGQRLYASLAVLASVVTLAYLLSLQRKVFFGKTDIRFAHIREAGFGLAFPMVILSALIIGFGLYTPFVLDKFIWGFIPLAGG